MEEFYARISQIHSTFQPDLNSIAKRELFLSTIQCCLITKFPLIAHYDGLTINYYGDDIEILIDEELEQELKTKYPESFK